MKLVKEKAISSQQKNGNKFFVSIMVNGRIYNNSNSFAKA